MEAIPLLAKQGTTGAGAAKEVEPPGAAGIAAQSYLRSFQVTLTGGGSATVKIQFSNDKSGWIDAATIDVAAATPSDGFSTEVPWKYVRANVTAIVTGQVNVTMGR